MNRKRLKVVWYGMRQRCSPSAHGYNKMRYYLRGIRVCRKWCASFEAFYKWAIENGYRHGLEIDRKDNDGNYTPQNCRFVTHLVNMRRVKMTPVKLAAVKNSVKLATAACTKLSAEQVNVIIKDPRTNKEIAKDYGVAAPYISQLRHGRRKSCPLSNPRGTSGIHNGRTKLTPQQVIEIRKDKRSQVIIAKEYGISPTQAGAIRRRETWRDLQ